jgi:Domain of unknown function (DUF4252)
MRMRIVAAVGCLASCLASPLLAAAQGAQLDLPSFSHLEKQASEVVDVTLGTWPLTLASRLIEADDQQSAEIKKVMAGIKSVAVRSYAFDSDFVYSKRDVDAVRDQLSGPGWSKVVQVRDRKKDQEVDIYIALDNDRATGFAIIASEPRKFTILNIVGALDIEQLAKLQQHLHLPDTDLQSIMEAHL